MSDSERFGKKYAKISVKVLIFLILREEINLFN